MKGDNWSCAELYTHDTTSEFKKTNPLTVVCTNINMHTNIHAKMFHAFYIYCLCLGIRYSMRGVKDMLINTNGSEMIRSTSRQMCRHAHTHTAVWTDSRQSVCNCNCVCSQIWSLGCIQPSNKMGKTQVWSGFQWCVAVWFRQLRKLFSFSSFWYQKKYNCCWSRAFSHGQLVSEPTKISCPNRSLTKGMKCYDESCRNLSVKNLSNYVMFTVCVGKKISCLDVGVGNMALK